MKKKLIALLLVLTIFPLALTSCFFNAYHARFDSDVQSYLDFDYVNSLESFDTTHRGEVYLIDDESVFEKVLPEYDCSVDFDKKTIILYVYSSGVGYRYYARSAKLEDGVLAVGVASNIAAVYLPGNLAAVMPHTRGFLLTIDKISFDRVEFVDLVTGWHPR